MPSLNALKCLSSGSFSFGAALISPQLWHLAERSCILSVLRLTCLTPGHPLHKLQSIYLCRAASSAAWSGGTAQVHSLRAKRVWINSSLAQSTPCFSYPNHKNYFVWACPPWILIIERFLGHARFISGKQGPSSDFLHTVSVRYTLSFNSETCSKGCAKIPSSSLTCSIHFPT